MLRSGTIVVSWMTDETWELLAEFAGFVPDETLTAWRRHCDKITPNLRRQWWDVGHGVPLTAECRGSPRFHRSPRHRTGRFNCVTVCCFLWACRRRLDERSYVRLLPMKRSHGLRSERFPFQTSSLRIFPSVSRTPSSCLTNGLSACGATRHATGRNPLSLSTSVRAATAEGRGACCGRPRSGDFHRI